AESVERPARAEHGAGAGTLVWGLDGRAFVIPAAQLRGVRIGTQLLPIGEIVSGNVSTPKDVANIRLPEDPAFANVGGASPDLLRDAVPKKNDEFVVRDRRRPRPRRARVPDPRGFERGHIHRSGPVALSFLGAALELLAVVEDLDVRAALTRRGER